MAAPERARERGEVILDRLPGATEDGGAQHQKESPVGPLLEVQNPNSIDSDALLKRIKFMQNICREVCVGLCYLNKLNLSQGLPGVLWKRGPG